MAANIPSLLLYHAGGWHIAFQGYNRTTCRDLRFQFMCYYNFQYDFMMEDPYLAAPPQEVDGKEILHFSGFVLVPPPPHAAPRSTREKPPGCKTLFIGGLPETVTEEMIGELMQTCGSMF